MYNPTTVSTSTSSPTYSLPRSRLGPEPSSSAYRYGSSTVSYTEPSPARQPALPIQASSLYPQPGSRTLLTKRNAGLVTLPCAHTRSACTATCPVHIPTLWGSNASMSVVDENPTQGSHALEDWWSQARVYPEDLPGQSSNQTSRMLPGLPAPSQPYAPVVAVLPWGWTLIPEAWSVTVGMLESEKSVSGRSLKPE
jgi:hypothetical protein